jgi:hypothetical protein
VVIEMGDIRGWRPDAGAERGLRVVKAENSSDDQQAGTTSTANCYQSKA